MSSLFSQDEFDLSKQIKESGENPFRSDLDRKFEEDFNNPVTEEDVRNKEGWIVVGSRDSNITHKDGTTSSGKKIEITHEDFDDNIGIDKAFDETLIIVSSE